MELREACVSAHREIGGCHAEVSHIGRKLDELAARSGGTEGLVPEIRGLHAAVEALDQKISDLGKQLPASSSSPSEDMLWYEWI